MESTPKPAEKMLPECEQKAKAEGACRWCGCRPLHPIYAELEALCVAASLEHDVSFYPPCYCWLGEQNMRDPYDGHEVLQSSVLMRMCWDTENWNLTLERLGKGAGWESKMLMTGHLLEDPAVFKAYIAIMIERKKPQ